MSIFDSTDVYGGVALGVNSTQLYWRCHSKEGAADGDLPDANNLLDGVGKISGAAASIWTDNPGKLTQRTPEAIYMQNSDADAVAFGDLSLFTGKFIIVSCFANFATIGNVQGIITYGNKNNGDYWGIEANSGKKLQLVLQQSQPSVSTINIPYNSNLSAGVEHHLCAVMDFRVKGTITATVYMDGVSGGGDTTSIIPEANAKGLFLMTRYNGNATGNRIDAGGYITEPQIIKIDSDISKDMDLIVQKLAQDTGDLPALLRGA